MHHNDLSELERHRGEQRRRAMARRERIEEAKERRWRMTRRTAEDDC
jgi:hypothetical protein